MGCRLTRDQRSAKDKHTKIDMDEGQGVKDWVLLRQA